MTVKDMTMYVQKPTTEATQLDEEWIVLNTETFTITKLNAIGGHCWNLLSTSQTVGTLLEAIKNEFSIENPDTEDMERFLSDLMSCGLIDYAH